MSLIADGLGGGTLGKTASPAPKGFDEAASKAASRPASADSAERQAEANKTAAAARQSKEDRDARDEPAPKPTPQTSTPASPVAAERQAEANKTAAAAQSKEDRDARDEPAPKPTPQTSTPVSPDAAERQAEANRASASKTQELPSGLPAYMYPGWTPPASTPDSASPVSADAAERQAQDAAGEICDFVPATPKTVVVQPGDTIWSYWKDDHAGLAWQPYKGDFNQQNAGILADGWLHPGETAVLPVPPGAGETVCTPIAPPAAATPQALPSGLPPYMYPGWTPPATPQALPSGLPPYLYPGWTPPAATPATTAAQQSDGLSLPQNFDDTMTWAKQGLFAVRAGARFFGLDAAKDAAAANNIPLSGGWSGLDTFSKVVGLGGFSIAQTALKAHEAYTNFKNGEWERGVANIAEGANGLRIGATGIAPLLSEGSQGFIAKYLSGTAGNAFGVVTNATAGVFKGIDIWSDANDAMAQATTQREKDQIQYTKWEQEVGNGLDTINDAAPFLMDAGSTWFPWLGGKIMDHAAAASLGDTAYKPVSIGAEKARNLMPLAAAAGLVPTVEQYDITPNLSDDERIVLEEMNSIDKAGDIGAGVAEIGITGTEVVATVYAGGDARVVYSVLQADHMARQALNIWTGDDWQNPQERAAAVEAAGLDPALDPHRVEYEQEDFLQRSMTSMMSDADIARLRGKAAAGGATADDKRFLEIVDQFDNADISDATDGRGSNDSWSSPSSVWQMAKVQHPELYILEQLPEAAGYALGYIQGGGIGKAVDAVQEKVGNVVEDIGNFASGVGDFASDVGDFASDVGDALTFWD